MKCHKINIRDFCCFENVEQSLAKQGLVWVTGENHDTEAADNNGSGKTSLSKAITWALFGETVDGHKGDDVIRRGQKRALVEIEVYHGGELWTVSRERKKGAPKLKLIQPDGTLYVGSKDEIQSRINNMMGLDFKAFRNTVLYGQNDSFKFAHPGTKDSERKDMLHRILNTSILQRCHERVKAQARDLKREMKQAENELELVIARLDEQDVENLKNDSESWEAAKAAAVEKIKNTVQSLMKQAKEEMKAGRVNIDELKERHNELVKALEAQRVEDGKADKSAATYSKIQDKRGIEEMKVVKIEAKMGLLKAQLKKLDGDICPVCTSELKSGAAAKHKAEIEAALKALTSKLASYDKKIGAMDVAMAKAKEAYEKHNAAAGNIDDTLGDIDDVKKAIWDAETIATRVSGYKERAQEALLEAKAKKAETNPYGARLKAALEKTKELKAQKKDWKTTLSRAANEAAHLEFWIKGFSNQGLPSYILDGVMPYITERANQYLKTLADGDISMEFNTQRELKSSKGEVRDEIDISWTIEGIDDNPPPSGGQFKKMEIATDMALMDLVATRENADIDLLILDEVLDGLDAEGRQRVVQLLLELKTRRGTILVISHQADMSEVFEKSITVVKKDKKSVLKVAA